MHQDFIDADRVVVDVRQGRDECGHRTSRGVVRNAIARSIGGGVGLPRERREHRIEHAVGEALAGVNEARRASASRANVEIGLDARGRVQVHALQFFRNGIFGDCVRGCALVGDVFGDRNVSSGHGSSSLQARVKK